MGTDLSNCANLDDHFFIQQETS